MTKKQKPRGPVVRIVGSCEMFATVEMQCPLCKVIVPANTPHKCERQE